MKKFLLFVLMIIALLSLCGCDDTTNGVNAKPTVMPYKPQQIFNKDLANFRIYVSGAVANEGYYWVMEGATISDVLFAAGLLSQTALPDDCFQIITCDKAVVINYVCDGKVCPAINVNGAYVANNLQIENIPSGVVQKLYDYISTHGAICNKQVLREILTEEEYQAHHYKFFIAEVDYEKAN